jgi:hypothetical protein
VGAAALVMVVMQELRPEDITGSVAAGGKEAASRADDMGLGRSSAANASADEAGARWGCTR